MQRRHNRRMRATQTQSTYVGFVLQPDSIAVARLVFLVSGAIYGIAMYGLNVGETVAVPFAVIGMVVRASRTRSSQMTTATIATSQSAVDAMSQSAADATSSTDSVDVFT